MKKNVVTCFIKYKGKILILKRSDKVRTHKGKWAGVSGYVEENEKPEFTAYKEVKEEVGLGKDEIVLKKVGMPFEIEREDWVVHTFLFETEKEPNISIDWEHTEYRWIQPDEIENYDTVPKLKEALMLVLS
ncbi:MAG: NUDIX pyrophosphatase [Candidatus Thermoplasmatota archaeon]